MTSPHSTKYWHRRSPQVRCVAGATARLDTYPVWHYCSGNVWGQVSNSHRQNACAPRPHTATRTHQGKHGEPHVVSNKTCREAHTRLLQVQVAVLRFRCATQHSVAVFRFGNGQPVCGVVACVRCTCSSVCTLLTHPQLVLGAQLSCRLAQTASTAPVASSQTP